MCCLRRPGAAQFLCLAAVTVPVTSYQLPVARCQLLKLLFRINCYPKDAVYPVRVRVLGLVNS